MVRCPSRVFPDMASDDIEPDEGLPAGDPITEAAINWFIRLRDDALSEAGHREFHCWHDASPLHARAYAEISAFWSELDALPLAPSPLRSLSCDPVPAVAARLQPRGSLWWRGAAGGLVAVLLALVFAPHLWIAATADLSSGTGEVRTFRLADGSRMMLDAQSAVSIALTDDQREVRLLRGRAWFDVAHEPRPFVVEVGSMRVRDIGTAFETGLRGDGGDVSVTQGLVELTIPHGRAITLAAGQSARFTSDGPVRLVQSPGSLAAWRGGQLQFVDMPLAEVLADLSRHGAGTPVLLPGDLSHHRVTGLVNLTDPVAARDTVLARAGTKARGFGRYYVVMKRSTVMQK